MTREETKQLTREALLDAGMGAFAEGGLHGPSLDAICARAGLTRGAFYVHFKDRDDFMEAVIQRTLGTFLELMLGQGVGPVDIRGTIARFASAISQDAMPAPAGGLKFHQLLDACERSRQIAERFQTLLGEASARLAHGVKHAQKQRALRDDVNTDATAKLLVSTALGLLVMKQAGVPFTASAIQRTLFSLLSLPPRG